MKLLLVVMLLSSFLLAANPFDNFVGKYEVVGNPIVKNNKAAFCNRFNFKNISKFEVDETKVPKYNNLTHTAYFRSAGYLEGWSGHPIQDFTETIVNPTNPATSTGHYAKTIGGTDFATNEIGSVGLVESEKLTVSIRKTKSDYLLTMKEELVSKGSVIASCHYEATLKQ